MASISASLVGTQAITNVLGLVYWAVAARQTNVAAVGIAGAAVSLMMLLGSFGMLGLGTLLMAELPRLPVGQRRVFVRTSLVTAAVASGVLGIVVVGVTAAFGGADLATLVSPFNLVDFAVGTALTGLTMVLDQAVLVVNRSRLQLERNTVASIVKIGAVIAITRAGHDTGMDIFLAWTIGNIVSLGWAFARTRRSTTVEHRRRTTRRLVDLGIMRRMARSAASHHALNLVLQAPIQLLSVVVVVLLSAEANGYFSTARSVAGFVFVVPFTITIALFASANGSESDLLARMRFTIPFGFAASIAADIVLWPLGGTVLGIFGNAYSIDALGTLRILVLAGLPFVIKDHFVALRRVQNRTTSAAVVSLAGAVFEVVAAGVGAEIGGTTWLCAFWVGALAIEATGLAVVMWRSAAGRTSGRETRLPVATRALSAAAQSHGGDS